MGGGSRKDEMTEIYGVEKCREATVVQGPQRAIGYKVPRSSQGCVWCGEAGVQSSPRIS